MAVNNTCNFVKNSEAREPFVRVAKGAKIVIPIREKASGKNQILLYLTGKTFGRMAALAPCARVNDIELGTESQIKMASLLLWLKGPRMADRTKHSNHVRNLYISAPINHSKDDFKMMIKRCGNNELGFN
jgi:hypothetical protein